MGEMYACLKEHMNHDDFERSCKKMVIERMREKAQGGSRTPVYSYTHHIKAFNMAALFCIRYLAQPEAADSMWC